jgi:hypothetical protein
MIQEGKPASSCSVPAAIPAKKQIIQASPAIIVTNMIGMGFCTGIFFPGEIKAEIFSASVAEFKGVSVQNCAADLTNTGLHIFTLRCKLRDLMGSLKGFVKGPHGILYLICLNDAGATGDGSADR